MKTIKRNINRVLTKFGYSYRFNKLMPLKQQQEKDIYCGKKILDDKQANVLITQKIVEGNPLLVGRLGAVELSAIYNSLLHNHKRVKWDKDVISGLQLNAGFFPFAPKLIEKFVTLYIDCIKQLDITGVWFNEGEEEVLEKYSQSEFIHLRAIEPYFHINPWSKYLRNKKVLVIHPFAESIEKQYYNHQTRLFQDQDILPEFTLHTIKAVQSIAGNETNYKNWFHALQAMYDEINKQDFDVAIIGAGAYGLPLGAFIKSIGKQAIHMGGATQILFGIKGRRWENIPAISKHFNEAWTRPSIVEVPKQSQLVEGGCYW